MSRRCRGEVFGPSTTSSTASPVLCRRCTEDLQASPPNPQHISLGSHDVATLPLCLFRIPHLPVLASCVSMISTLPLPLPPQPFWSVLVVEHVSHSSLTLPQLVEPSVLRVYRTFMSATVQFCRTVASFYAISDPACGISSI